MHSRHLAFAALLFTMAACAATSRPVTPWKLELTTSGGIAGRGTGSIAIDSDGAIAVRTMDGKECSFTATETELRELTAVLADARPEKWKTSYSPENKCCDRFEYVLTYTEGGTKTSVSWIDDPLPMPRDLTAVAEAVRGRLRANVERCRTR